MVLLSILLITGIAYCFGLALLIVSHQEGVEPLVGPSIFCHDYCVFVSLEWRLFCTEILYFIIANCFSLL